MIVERFVWTKSLIFAADQCPKRIYLQLFHPDLANPLNASDRARFETGRMIGSMARQLFPNGILCQEFGVPSEELASKTRSLIELGNETLFEPTFITEVGGKTCLARLDILTKTELGWTIYEVKSGKSASDEYKKDLAFQALVLRESGLAINQTCLILVNGDAVRKDRDLDPHSFLKIEDVTEDVAELLTDIEKLVFEVEVPEEQPQIDIGRHCTKPYPCLFYDHCHEGLENDSIVNLPGIRGDTIANLFSRGIRRMSEIPEGTNLTKNQQRAVSSVQFNVPQVDNELRKRLETVQFPAHFIDFEAANPALPLYPGMRPYQSFPFQWSSHSLDSPDSEAIHNEFLHEEQTDPRAKFVESLLGSLQTAKCVVFYSNYEIQTIKQLMMDGYELAENLHNILQNKGVDLLKIIRDHVYFAEFRGSFSIKKVLPAMVHHLGYDHLDIKDGQLAATEYLRLISSATNDNEKAKISKALREYCGLDTLAMVELYRALVNLTNSS